MSITNSLYIGSNGLRAHGEAISVVGDNIANVSTIGFKRSRASFQDVLGGELTNQRFGGGSYLGENQQLWEQGTVQQTGNGLDIAINGGGTFVVKGKHGGRDNTYFTRDGRFSLDNQGFAVNQGGLRLQGYSITNGTRSTSIGDLPLGARTSPAIASTKAGMNLNLDPSAELKPAFDPASPEATSNYATSVTVHDSLGAAHKVEVYFRSNGAGAWEWHAMANGAELTGGAPGLAEIGSGTLQFNTDGSLQSETGSANASFLNATGGQAIAFDFGDDIATGGTGREGTTQLAGDSKINSVDVDGRSAGSLVDVAISEHGVISGTYDNGDTIDIAQLALADFANYEGLERVGDGLMTYTHESGQPVIDAAGTGRRGSTIAGALEGSNVDLGTELVTLIAYQRAFQANSKTVTTADEMLSDVNNLKR